MREVIVSFWTRKWHDNICVWTDDSLAWIKNRVVGYVISGYWNNTEKEYEDLDKYTEKDYICDAFEKKVDLNLHNDIYD